VEGGVIHIFTDSRTGLDNLEKTNRSSINVLSQMAMAPALAYAAKLSTELQERGVQLVLCWLPGHKHNVAGHGIADLAAHDCFVQGNNALSALQKKKPKISES
jgi:hypothetical protein